MSQISASWAFCFSAPDTEKTVSSRKLDIGGITTMSASAVTSTTQKATNFLSWASDFALSKKTRVSC